MAYRVTSKWPRNQPGSFTWLATLIGIALVVVGFGLAAYWAGFALGRGNLPQGIWTVRGSTLVVFHLAAEFVTAFLAVVGGIGLLRGRGWGLATAFTALGALLYTSLNTLGWATLNAPRMVPVLAGGLVAVFLSFIALHFGRRA